MSFPLRLPEDVKAQLTAAAKAQDRSLNWLIVDVMRQYLAAQVAEQQREPADVLSGQLSRPPAASSTETVR
jgi:predicted transcriptional regulator